LDVTRPHRRVALRIRDSLRGLYGRERFTDEFGTERERIPAPAKCGRVAHGGGITVMRTKVADGHGSAHLQGLVSCNSVWACPCCADKILAKRAAQVKQAVAWAAYQGHHVKLVTMTMRHSFGDDVAHLVHGVADAWRLFWQGREAQAFKKKIGLVGWIRRIESTHGENGFHPHIHAIVITERELTGDDWAEWSMRWRTYVARGIGAAHAPTMDRGVDISDIDSEGEYIAKAGLELAGDLLKGTKHGNRTIWAVAESAGRGNVNDATSWRAWVAGTKGVRLLTWSAGFRKLAGIRGEPGEADLPELEALATMDRAEWRALRDLPDAVDVVLTVAECGATADGVRRAIEAILARSRLRGPDVPSVRDCVALTCPACALRVVRVCYSSAMRAKPTKAKRKPGPTKAERAKEKAFFDEHEVQYLARALFEKNAIVVELDNETITDVRENAVELATNCFVVSQAFYDVLRTRPKKGVLP
jgi:hypothetical protein